MTTFFLQYYCSYFFMSILGANMDLVRSTWNRRSTVFGSACTQICVCTQSRMRLGLGIKLHPSRWAREPLDICSYTWPALMPFGTGCCQFAILLVRTEMHAMLATLLKHKFVLSRSPTLYHLILWSPYTYACVTWASIQQRARTTSTAFEWLEHTTL
jgi:hypothetical protein